jgi:hypothetical protein
MAPGAMARWGHADSRWLRRVRHQGRKAALMPQHRAVPQPHRARVWWPASRCDRGATIPHP